MEGNILTLLVVRFWQQFMFQMVSWERLQICGKRLLAPSCLSVCLSVSMSNSLSARNEQPDSQGTDFDEILILEYFF